VRYSEWLVRWCKQLLAHAARHRRDYGEGEAERAPRRLTEEQRGLRRRADLLLACEPCVRFDPQLALQLLPYLVLFLLAAEEDAAAAAGSAAAAASSWTGGIGSELLVEVGAVVSHRSGGAGGGVSAPRLMHSEHPLCCQAVFSLLEGLLDWSNQCRAQLSAAQGSASLRAKQRIDSFLRRLPAMQLARCALECGSAHRTLLLLERRAQTSPGCNLGQRSWADLGQRPRRHRC